MKLFVANIPADVPEELLKQQIFPSATNVKLVKDLTTGQSKGFAFVDIDDLRIADKIVGSLNGYVLVNNKLAISYVKDDTTKPSVKSDRGTPSSFDDPHPKRRKDFKQIRKRSKDDFDDSW